MQIYYSYIFSGKTGEIHEKTQSALGEFRDLHKYSPERFHMHIKIQPQQVPR
jgi:hypothetical protein